MRKGPRVLHAELPTILAKRSDARFRVRQDECDGVPTCLILAPCSGPSRRVLTTTEQVVSHAGRGGRAKSRRPGTIM
jgi:hypothetical protein